MNICFVLPPFFFNPDSQGFNEMLVAEMAAVCEQYATTTICKEYPRDKADIYILAVQYREDVLSDWLKQSIAQCKNKGGMVIVGGKAASVEYEFILRQCDADFVFLGEIEETLEEILYLQTPLHKENIKRISGLAYMEEGRVEYKFRELKKPLDDYPLARYTYMGEGRKQYPICVMETSRCCHGKCNFCEGYLFRQQNYGNKYRVKSPERVVSEIEKAIDMYNCHIFSFSDDNFFADGNYGVERAEEIAKLIIEKKIRIRFTIECRADDVNYHTMSLLKKAGLCKVFIGIESGSQTVLNRYNKGTSVAQNHHAIKVLNDLRIPCHPGHILFDPLTTREELEETVSFFQPYLGNLFSFNDGFDSRLLFFPHGCAILQLYWPNQTAEFYDNVCYNGVRFSFLNPETELIYQKFVQNLNDPNKYSNCNLLERRIYCLKDALEETR